MANFELYYTKLLKWAGGYVNNPKDPGGATNYDITFNTYKSICLKENLPEPTIEDLQNISEETVKRIYKTYFWDDCLADKIDNQSIAEIFVDFLIGSGGIAIIIVQNIIGTTPDRICGINTITCLNSKKAKDTFNFIKQARIDYINRLIKLKPELEIFFNGWMNRINSFNFE
jgi:type VI secretion system secreted protein VgrG